MVDFHGHFLPNIDDGSQSIEISLELVAQSHHQGVKTMVATPHFYGHRESPHSFFQRRQQSWTQLQPHINTTQHPDILLGAEVAYSPGISQWDGLQEFCIQGTNLLLLELPYTPCPPQCYRDIEALRQQGIIPLMAHVERYFPLQSSATLVKTLLESGALIQCNADFFVQGWKSRQAFSLLQRGHIHAIGSDCHNLTTRPPNLGQAYEKIQEKLGDSFTKPFLQWHNTLLSPHSSTLL